MYGPIYACRFFICYFSIWISSCVVNEVIDAVVNAATLSFGKMYSNISNYSYHGWFNFTGIEEEGANDLLAVDYL